MSDMLLNVANVVLFIRLYAHKSDFTNQARQAFTTY